MFVRYFLFLLSCFPLWADLRDLPVYFEPNLGQADSRVRFVGRGGGMLVLLADTEVTVLAGNRTTSGMVRMRISGAQAPRTTTPRAKQSGYSNYLVGSDDRRWRRNIPHFGRVDYFDIYPGVNVTFYGTPRQLEYDFVLSPGANPGRIELTYEGASALSLDAAGDLVLTTPAGALRQHKPLAYQRIAGRRIDIEARYRLRGRTASFVLGRYDPRFPLTIDPVLSYATFLGGAQQDRVLAVAADPKGNAYFTGQTKSAAFPATAQAFDSSFNPTFTAFVTKLNPAGNTLIYSTFFGGGSDQGNAIAVDGSGSVVIGGETNANSGFPLQAAFRSDFGGSVTGFVARLTPAGDGIIYSSYIPGLRETMVQGVALDSSGNAYLTGATYGDQTGTPKFTLTAGSYKSEFAGLHWYAFVIKLTNSGALVFSTFLMADRIGFDNGCAGGGQSIAVDAGGSAWVTGWVECGLEYASDDDFAPTAMAFQTVACDAASSAPKRDAFLFKLSSNGTMKQYLTFLCSAGAADHAYGVAVDAAGNAYVTGSTSGTGFPTTPGAFDTSASSAERSFVAKFSSAGAVIYSTFVSVSARGRSVAADDLGNAYLTGETWTGSYPTTSGAFQTTLGSNGYSDAYLTVLNSAGSNLIYSTYYGGNRQDFGTGIALSSGSVFIGGYTAATAFDTPNTLPITAGAYDTTYNLSGDGFGARFSFHTPSAAVRDSFGAIQLSQFGSTALQNAGGVFQSDPVVGQNTLGDTLVMAVDGFDALWANVFRYAPQSWAGWQFGGGRLKGNPALSIGLDGKAWFLVRDAWNGCWLGNYSAESGFSAWTFLGGVFPHVDMTMDAASDGTLYMAGKDNWHGLWTARYVPGVGFEGWKFAGGIVKGKPSLVVGSDQAAYVAVRDNSDGMWVARVQGDVVTWFYGGGMLGQDPQVAVSNGKVFVAIADPTDGIWYRSRSEGVAGAWQDWVLTGGVLKSYSPAALDGVLYIAGRAANNALWWYELATPAWFLVGHTGSGTRAPAAAPR